MAETRTFVAASLDPEAITTLQSLVERLRRASWGGAFRWSAPDTWHLTIKFVGDVPDERMDCLCRAVAGAAIAVEPFAFSLRGLGCFPNPRRPSILWVGVEESTGRVADLARHIDAALACEGWPAEERPFHPHLTIGRARPGARREEWAALADALAPSSGELAPRSGELAPRSGERAPRSGAPLARVAVERLTVYGSVLAGAGPVHTPLCVCPLGGF